jgi:uncharacterized protein YndB with AHSA1/START domain
MGPISLSRTIDAPRERVFDLISDLSRRPAWTDHFLSGYRLAREQPSGTGAAARFRVGAPGGIDYMETVIADAERPGRIVEKGRGGRWDRTAVHAVWELRGAPEGPTDVALTFWTEPGNLLDRVRELRAGRWWKRRWGRALKRLSGRLEGDSAEQAPVRVGGEDRVPIDSRPA